MARRPAAHRIKKNMVYTVAEAAEALGRDPRTVIRWIKDGGLKADASKKPWLIRGGVLKDWLEARRESGRTRLRPGEIWCLPCRKAIRPGGGVADFVPGAGRAGRLVGLCPCCERLVHRAVSAMDLDRIRGDLEVAPA